MSSKGSHAKYSTEEKEKLASLAEEYKAAYEREKEAGEKVWDRRRKKFVKKSSDAVKEGYLAKAVREMFPSLNQLKADDPEFVRAVKVAKRALENREGKRKAGEDVDVGSKKRFREAGGGRKAQAEEVRQALYCFCGATLCAILRDCQQWNVQGWGYFWLPEKGHCRHYQ